jgi:uncharacterized protein YhaN
MAYGPEVVQAVRTAYVYEAMDAASAAQKGGVNEATARSWKARARKNGDDWDKARLAFDLSKGGVGDLSNHILARFTRNYNAVMDLLESHDLDPLEKVDAMARSTKALRETRDAVKDLQPKLHRQGVALEVLRLLSEFASAEHPQHLPALVAILEPFGPYLQARING